MGRDALSWEIAAEGKPISLAGVGIGLRHPHYQAFQARRPALGFVEVHSENFFAAGGASMALLDEVRQGHAVSLHGVGLSLGSACGVDEQHLGRLASLVKRVEPVRVSDHACFARVEGMGMTGNAAGRVAHASDLLPLVFNPASLDILVANVDRVQNRLRRPMLVENLSAYLAYDDDVMPEATYLTALCRRSGCQLLLDLNNLIVNGLNRARPLPDALAIAAAQADAVAFLHALPPDIVGEIHLAGFRWPDQPDHLVVDDHSQRVSEAGWQVFRAALAHLGASVPTLIEWDMDLPELEVLLDEAFLAARYQTANRQAANRQAVPAQAAHDSATGT